MVDSVPNATKADKGIPPSSLPSPISIPPYYGSPISSGAIMGVSYYGIQVFDISNLSRIRRCAILGIISSILLFIRSMMLYSIWHGTMATFDFILLFLLWLFLYPAFYSRKRALLYGFAFVAGSCILWLFTSIVTLIARIAYLSRTDLVAIGWTEAQASHHNRVGWACVIFAFGVICATSSLVWYVLQTFVKINDASMYSLPHTTTSWRNPRDILPGERVFGSGVNESPEVAIGKTVSFNPA